MRDWRQLKPRRSSLFDLVKGAALLAVLGVVLYFGWGLFFPSSQESPGDALGDSPQQFSTSTAASTEVSMGSDLTNILTPTSVPVETIGTQAPAIGETVRVGGHPPEFEEMPALQQSYERFKDQGYVVLGVNWAAADDPDLVGPYVEELGLTFPILLDRDSTVSEGLYNLLGLPTSVFVGRDGIIREIIIGALELETLEFKITSMLEENL
jgi:hypothetical protein